MNAELTPKLQSVLQTFCLCSGLAFLLCLGCMNLVWLAIMGEAAAPWPWYDLTIGCIVGSAFTALLYLGIRLIEHFVLETYMPVSWKWLLPLLVGVALPLCAIFSVKTLTVSAVRLGRAHDEQAAPAFDQIAILAQKADLLGIKVTLGSDYLGTEQVSVQSFLANSLLYLAADLHGAPVVDHLTRLAYDSANRAIALNPNEHTANEMRAYALSRLGEHQKAEVGWSQVIQLEPSYARAYLERGRELDSMGQFKQAAGDFLNAPILDPQNASISDQAMRCLENRIYRSEVVPVRLIGEAASESIKLHPNFRIAYMTRAIASERLGERQKALDACNKIVNLDPRNARSYALRATTLLGLGKVKEALDDYTEAIHLNPKNACYYGSRGFCQNKLGHFQAAISDFSQCISMKPQEPDIYYDRAESYESLQSHQWAIDDYSKAISMYPYKIRRYLVEPSGKGHKSGQPSEVFDLTRRDDVKSLCGAAYYKRAKIYENIGQRDLASKDLEAAKKVDSEEMAKLKGFHLLKAT